jgi:hypothetical protein
LQYFMEEMFFDVKDFDNPFKKQTTFVKNYDVNNPDFESLLKKQSDWVVTKANVNEVRL